MTEARLIGHTGGTNGDALDDVCPAPGRVVAARRLVAEGLGTALLVAAVVGSGIMAQQLAQDPAIRLLCNSIATGGALIALLLMFGPISGAHLNPAVTLSLAMARALPLRVAAGYVVVQIAGGLVGAVAANAMFALEPVTMSTTMRTGTPMLLSEGIATFGLIGVVIGVGRTRAAAAPFAVAAYIVAAYWFTASTSFANPAVTLARAFSDTYAGIRLADVAAFIAAQGIGAALGAVLFSWLVPLPPRELGQSHRTRAVPGGATIVSDARSAVFPMPSLPFRFEPTHQIEPSL
jgi:glycerol uptake facilitator-like aquaporin